MSMGDGKWTPVRKQPGRPSTGRVTQGRPDFHVLLPDHVPAYITWSQYEQNVARLEANRNRADTIGAVRHGPSLLAGLLVCGFLRYTFRPRVVKNRKRHSLFVRFTPAVSSAAQKAMRQTTRRRNFRNRTDPEPGRYCPLPQPGTAGMVGVLWAVLSLGDVSGAAAFQPDVGCLGDAKVSTAQGGTRCGRAAS